MERSQGGVLLKSWRPGRHRVVASRRDARASVGRVGVDMPSEPRIWKQAKNTKLRGIGGKRGQGRVGGEAWTRRLRSTRREDRRQGGYVAGKKSDYFNGSRCSDNGTSEYKAICCMDELM